MLFGGVEYAMLPALRGGGDARKRTQRRFSKSRFGELIVRAESWGLEEIPEEIFQKILAKILVLSNNRINYLPERLGCLTGLRVLKLNSNQWVALLTPLGELVEQIRMIPSGVACLTYLEEFNISDNLIMDLPVELGLLIHLVKLNVSGNPLMGNVPNSNKPWRVVWYGKLQGSSLENESNSGSDESQKDEVKMAAERKNARGRPQGWQETTLIIKQQTKIVLEILRKALPPEEMTGLNQRLSAVQMRRAMLALRKALCHADRLPLERALSFAAQQGVSPMDLSVKLATRALRITNHLNDAAHARDKKQLEEGLHSWKEHRRDIQDCQPAWLTANVLTYSQGQDFEHAKFALRRIQLKEIETGFREMHHSPHQQQDGSFKTDRSVEGVGDMSQSMVEPESDGGDDGGGGLGVIEAEEGNDPGKGEGGQRGEGSGRKNYLRPIHMTRKRLRGKAAYARWLFNKRQLEREIRAVRKADHEKFKRDAEMRCVRNVIKTFLDKEMEDRWPSQLRDGFPYGTFAQPDAHVMDVRLWYNTMSRINRSKFYRQILRPRGRGDGKKRNTFAKYRKGMGQTMWQKYLRKGGGRARKIHGTKPRVHSLKPYRYAMRCRRQRLQFGYESLPDRLRPKSGIPPFQKKAPTVPVPFKFCNRTPYKPGCFRPKLPKRKFFPISPELRELDRKMRLEERRGRKIFPLGKENEKGRIPMEESDGLRTTQPVVNESGVPDEGEVEKGEAKSKRRRRRTVLMAFVEELVQHESHEERLKFLLQMYMEGCVEGRMADQSFLHQEMMGQPLASSQMHGFMSDMRPKEIRETPQMSYVGFESKENGEEIGRGGLAEREIGIGDEDEDEDEDLVRSNKKRRRRKVVRDFVTFLTGLESHEERERYLLEMQLEYKKLVNGGVEQENAGGKGLGGSQQENRLNGDSSMNGEGGGELGGEVSEKDPEVGNDSGEWKGDGLEPKEAEGVTGGSTGSQDPLGIGRERVDVVSPEEAENGVGDLSGGQLKGDPGSRAGLKGGGGVKKVDHPVENVTSSGRGMRNGQVAGGENPELAGVDEDGEKGGKVVDEAKPVVRDGGDGGDLEGKEAVGDGKEMSGGSHGSRGLSGVGEKKLDGMTPVEDVAGAEAGSGLGDLSGVQLTGGVGSRGALKGGGGVKEVEHPVEGVTSSGRGMKGRPVAERENPELAGVGEIGGSEGQVADEVKPIVGAGGDGGDSRKKEDVGDGKKMSRGSGGSQGSSGVAQRKLDGMAPVEDVAGAQAGSGLGDLSGVQLTGGVGSRGALKGGGGVKEVEHPVESATSSARGMKGGGAIGQESLETAGGGENTGRVSDEMKTVLRDGGDGGDSGKNEDAGDGKKMRRGSGGSQGLSSVGERKVDGMTPVDDVAGAHAGNGVGDLSGVQLTGGARSRGALKGGGGLKKVDSPVESVTSSARGMKGDGAIGQESPETAGGGENSGQMADELRVVVRDGGNGGDSGKKEAVGDGKEMSGGSDVSQGPSGVAQGKQDGMSPVKGVAGAEAGSGLGDLSGGQLTGGVGSRGALKGGRGVKEVEHPLEGVTSSGRGMKGRPVAQRENPELAEGRDNAGNGEQGGDGVKTVVRDRGDRGSFGKNSGKMEIAGDPVDTVDGSGGCEGKSGAIRDGEEKPGGQEGKLVGKEVGPREKSEGGEGARRDGDIFGGVHLEGGAASGDWKEGGGGGRGSQMKEGRLSSKNVKEGGGTSGDGLGEGVPATDEKGGCELDGREGKSRDKGIERGPNGKVVRNDVDGAGKGKAPKGSKNVIKRSKSLSVDDGGVKGVKRSGSRRLTQNGDGTMGDSLGVEKLKGERVGLGESEKGPKGSQRSSKHQKGYKSQDRGVGLKMGKELLSPDGDVGGVKRTVSCERGEGGLNEILEGSGDVVEEEILMRKSSGGGRLGRLGSQMSGNMRKGQKRSPRRRKEREGDRVSGGGEDEEGRGWMVDGATHEVKRNGTGGERARKENGNKKVKGLGRTGSLNTGKKEVDGKAVRDVGSGRGGGGRRKGSVEVGGLGMVEEKRQGKVHQKQKGPEKGKESSHRGLKRVSVGDERLEAIGSQAMKVGFKREKRGGDREKLVGSSVAVANDGIEKGSESVIATVGMEKVLVADRDVELGGKGRIQVVEGAGDHSVLEDEESCGRIKVVSKEIGMREEGVGGMVSSVVGKRRVVMDNGVKKVVVQVVDEPGEDESVEEIAGNRLVVVSGEGGGRVGVENEEGGSHGTLDGKEWEYKVVKKSVTTKVVKGDTDLGLADGKLSQARKKWVKVALSKAACEAMKDEGGNGAQVACGRESKMNVVKTELDGEGNVVKVVELDPEEASEMLKVMKEGTKEVVVINEGDSSVEVSSDGNKIQISKPVEVVRTVNKVQVKEKVVQRMVEISESETESDLEDG